MSRVFTPKDCHNLMNLLVKQATGQQSIAVVDSSTFVSAGETVLATGMENVINSLNIVLGRTIVASRPYSAKLNSIKALNSGVYTNRLRKISFYSKNALADGDHNTDLFTNLAEGYTAGQNEESGTAKSTKSMWEQNQPVCLEMNFAGTSVWQDCITMYEDQLQIAFRSESDFASFIGGYLTEHGNDIQAQIEAWNRLALVNKIAQIYDMSALMSGAAVNLTYEFNQRFGTNYTSAQLRGEYLDDFLKFFVAEFKKASDFMTERSMSYHWNPAKTVNGETYNLLRHTPYAKQKVFLYEPLFTEARANVLPDIFRPEYLDMKTQYEGVTFWQAQKDRAAIHCIPAVIDPDTGLQKAGTEVNLPYVVGCILDEDSLMTDFQMQTARTTPLEARKGYRNTWNSFARNIISDPTENAIIFVMMD